MPKFISRNAICLHHTNSVPAMQKKKINQLAVRMRRGGGGVTPTPRMQFRVREIYDLHRDSELHMYWTAYRHTHNISPSFPQSHQWFNDHIKSDWIKICLQSNIYKSEKACLLISGYSTQSIAMSQFVDVIVVGGHEWKQLSKINRAKYQHIIYTMPAAILSRIHEHDPKRATTLNMTLKQLILWHAIDVRVRALFEK